MPIGVALPGYRPAQAGAVADVLNFVNNAMTGAKQRASLEQETKAKDLANQQTEMGMAANKQLMDGESPLSQATVGGLGAQAAMAKQTAQKLGYDASPFDQIINATKNGVQTGVGPDGQPQTRKMTGFEAVNMAKQYSPLFQSFEDLQKAQITGGAAKERNRINEDRLNETKNQNAVEAGSAFDKNPFISTNKTNLLSIKKSIGILSNQNKPVTAKDLNLAQNDYINSVAQGGAATEGKVNREMQDSWKADFNDFLVKSGLAPDDDSIDLRKSPQGQALIGRLRENMRDVHGILKDAIKNEAHNVANNYASNTNPKVRDTVKTKLGQYTTGLDQQFPDFQGGQARAALAAAHPQASQALQWAQKNPNDPKAKEIMNRLKASQTVGE